jgi:hypothetical protein
MITIVGVVADALGAAVQWVGVPVNGRSRNFDVKREFTSTPSTEYRSVQAAEIAVDVDHGPRVGAVKYLERTERRLYAVCEIDGARLEGPLYFSPEIHHYGGRDIELRALAVTQRPASIALGPITRTPGRFAKPLRGSFTKMDGKAKRFGAPTHMTARASTASRS